MPVKTVNKVAVISSQTVSDHLAVEHESLVRLIEKHRLIIERDFGVLRFEIGKPSDRGGRPQKWYNLTEAQAVFITTLSRNTPQVVELKSLITRSFIYFRNAVQNKKQQREITRLQKVIEYCQMLLHYKNQELNGLKQHHENTVAIKNAHINDLREHRAHAAELNQWCMGKIQKGN